MKTTLLKHYPKLRPRFQREVVRWLQENHHHFSTPLRLATRTDTMMEFTFPELTSSLSVRFSPQGVRVSVTRGDVEFDAILDLVIHLERSPLGYYCGLQYPDQRQFFATRSAIWQSVLFEPFLDWVNQDLAPARWLRFFRFGLGSSSASLIYSEEDIQRPDPAMRLVASLKNIDDLPICVPGRDDINVWVVSLRGEEREVCYRTKIQS